MSLESIVASGDQGLLVAALAAGANASVVLPEYHGKRDTNLICVAAREGNDQVIDPLLEAGASLNHRTADGLNALHIAARYGHLKVISKLVSLGMNVNSYSERGLNALHIAMIHGHLTVLSELGALGMNINSCTQRGFNAMHIAAQHGHPHVLRELVAQGINVNTWTTSGGLSALHIAAEHGHPQVLSELKTLGIDVNAITPRGLNAMHIAAEHGHSQVLNELKTLGMDVNFSTTKGMTPLHYAVRCGHPHCVEKLAKLGACLDLRDKWKMTPIMLAARENQMDCVKVLASAGADVYATDMDGRTPLDLARFERHRQVVDWLKEHISKIAKMHNKGTIHVFNMVDFPDERNKRLGAESDSKNINNTFKNLGYAVHIHTNYTLVQMNAKLEEIQKDTTLNSLITFILSHGNDRYSFKTSDDSIMDLQKVRNMFTDTACPTLKGKTKIFFANFCRGDLHELVNDSETFPDPTSNSTGAKHEPPHNMVTIHASTEGIKAVRHTGHGTIFIQCLCKSVKDNPKLELRKIFNNLHLQMKDANGTTPMKEDFPPVEDFYF